VVLLVAQMAAAQKKTPIADGWIAAWNSHDAEKVVAIFTTDVLFEDVTFSAVNHGSAELHKFAASITQHVAHAITFPIEPEQNRKLLPKKARHFLKESAPPQSIRFFSHDRASF
jgi:hypothetical protein